MKKEMHKSAPAPNIILELIQYNEKDFAGYVNLGIDELLAKQKPDQVNWVNLDGLSDTTIINKIGEHYSLHSLLVEDISKDQQPKVEEYDDYLLFRSRCFTASKKT